MSAIADVKEMMEHINEFHWYKDELIVHVYPFCMDEFMKCLRIMDCEEALDAKLQPNDVAVLHFEEYLMWHHDLDLEDIKALFNFEEMQYGDR